MKSGSRNGSLQPNAIKFKQFLNLFEKKSIFSQENCRFASDLKTKYLKLVRKIGPSFIFLALAILLLVNSDYLELYQPNTAPTTEQRSDEISAADETLPQEDTQHVISSLSLDAVVISASLVLSPFTIEWISFDFPDIIDLSFFTDEAPRQIPEISTIFCRIIQINAP